MYKIMIVEDEMQMANLLKEYLDKYEYECTITQQFDDILNQFKQLEPHLVLMDINLPHYDGYYWARKIRSISNCPIMILSARMSDLDQVYGIESGADDFIIKPYSLQVVLAKINGQIRRVYGEYAEKKSGRLFERGNTTLNIDTVSLITEKKEEMLSVKELQLCTLLFEAYPNVVTRQQLLSAIWDSESFVEENTLSVNMMRLRKKLEQIESNLEVVTIRGIGYQLKEKDK